jgi:hypothetical protein
LSPLRTLLPDAISKALTVRLDDSSDCAMAGLESLNRQYTIFFSQIIINKDDTEEASSLR